jgi:hypothetical protein
MKKLVVIRTYPKAYLEKPGVEEIAGEVSGKTEQHLVDFVNCKCKADPGCCGYRIEEIEM